MEHRPRQQKNVCPPIDQDIVPPIIITSHQNHIDDDYADDGPDQTTGHRVELSQSCGRWVLVFRYMRF